MGILDLIFPKICVGCGKHGTYFCALCIASSKWFFPQLCPVCERPTLDGVTHKRCKTNISPEGLISIWVYEKSPRKLIQKLKYKFVYDVALSLASPVAGLLKSIQRNTPETPVWADEKWIIIPIPLHWTRKNWRGFNQSEKFATLLAVLIGWKVSPILIRTKAGQHQVGLKAKDRKGNVSGIFSLKTNNKVSKDSNLLILDDVWTTGATMLEAVKVLKEAGYKNVWCLTLAR
jgi:competence protein ComFC